MSAGGSKGVGDELTPEIIFLVERTARLVAEWGSQMEKCLMDEDAILHNFLNVSDPSHAFYQKKLSEYRSFKSIDKSGCICHAKPYPGTPTTRMELGIIKIAAQFAARYGMNSSLCYLSNRFNMKSYLVGSEVFYRYVAAYKRVLARSSYNRASTTASLLDSFFRCTSLEKLVVKGVETDEAIIDLHAFVGGVDYFAHMDYDDPSAIPEPLSMIMNRLGKAQNQDKAFKDIQPGASATHECVGDAGTELGPPPPSSMISLVDLSIIKLTAQFVKRYGLVFRRALMRRVVMNPRFDFLYFRPSLTKREVMDPQLHYMEQTRSRFDIFFKLGCAYSRVLKPSRKLRKSDACTATVLDAFFGLLQLEKLEERVETAMIDLHAFVGGVDYFAYMEDVNYPPTIMPPPERLSVMMNGPPLGSRSTEYYARNQDERTARIRAQIRAQIQLAMPSFLPNRRRLISSGRGITVKEFGIIKLTAQFFVRYGDNFLRGLSKRLGTDPQFEFVGSSHSRYDVFMSVVHAYDRVLKGSKKLKKSDAWAATVFDCFFHRLQLEKLEKGVETAIAMTDLHASTSGVDCFACMDYDEYAAIMPPPERLSMMINRLTLMQPDMPVHPPVGPQLAQNQGATHECVGDAQPDLKPPLSKRCYCFLYPLPDWIELKELGIMKLTALFVARYGMYFCWGLMKKVDKKPQFKFMEPTDNNYSVYNRILGAYERVIEPCCDSNYRVCTATVLDAFFSRLQLDRLEEGAETAMIDLHAFLCGADCFAHVEDGDYSTFMPNPALLSFMSNRLIRFRMLPPGSHLFYPYPNPYDQWLPGSSLFYPYPSMGMMQPALPMPGMSPHPPLPLPEEPEPKRQKFDESALVPEDQFISPHPGPARVRIWD